MLYETTTLTNGIRIATREMPPMKSVSVGIWVSVGGRHEPEELCGISHFLEHLLFKGTKRRSAKDITKKSRVWADLSMPSRPKIILVFMRRPGPNSCRWWQMSSAICF